MKEVCAETTLIEVYTWRSFSRKMQWNSMAYFLHLFNINIHSEKVKSITSGILHFPEIQHYWYHSQLRLSPLWPCTENSNWKPTHWNKAISMYNILQWISFNLFYYPRKNKFISTSIRWVLLQYPPNLFFFKLCTTNTFDFNSISSKNRECRREDQMWDFLKRC